MKTAGQRSPRLLLLFGVQSVLAQPATVFHQLELFATRLAAQRVVVVTGFVADEEHGFDLFLTLSHSTHSSSKSKKPAANWRATSLRLYNSRPEAGQSPFSDNDGQPGHNEAIGTAAAQR